MNTHRLVLALTVLVACHTDSSPSVPDPATLASPGIAPVARIQAACADPGCETMWLSAHSSTDAQTLRWTVDGELAGTGDSIWVAMAGDFDGDQRPDSRVVEVSLTAVGQGSHTTHMALLTAPMVHDDLLQPHWDDGTGAIIVIGVHAAVMALGYETCGDLVTVTAFSGCLLDTEQTWVGLDKGVGGLDPVVHDVASDAVTHLGPADAAAWQVGGETRFAGGVTAETYGASYPKVATAQSMHLTAYARMDPGGTLTTTLHHELDLDTLVSTVDQWTLDCTTGMPLVEATSTMDNGVGL